MHQVGLLRQEVHLAALAADVRRFLDDEPITARPASFFEQARRLARRNRALVVGTAAVFVALVAGILS